MLLVALFLPVTTVLASDGAALYKKSCVKCHGADGKAKTKMGKKLKCRDLSDPAVQAKLTDAQIAKSILEGVKDGSKTRMKPIKGLSKADVDALVKYVRTLKK
jgi:mono/diheme cytochrome c family protein